jgi:beta-galactosidase
MWSLKSSIKIWLIFACFMICPFLRAQHTERLVVDASAPFVLPTPSSFHGGASVSPTEGTLGLNSRYLTLNGQPWLPVMGEFQFSRYPEAEWEEEILKMKAGGVNVIGLYVFWIHHEEVEGQFDWTGQRDLRRFVQLCAKHGLYVYPRIGPWAHGEARNGGFPDWLVAKIPKSRLRIDDPVYMSYVARYFKEMGNQLQGLMWKDGGPVIGVQLENEYSNQDDAAGKLYLLSLKKLGIQDGLDVPYYTVTGWGHAVVPKGEAMPVYGNYPDAPWGGSMTNMPPSGAYNFSIRNQISGDMGMIGKNSGVGAEAHPAEGTPSMTVEMGGGVQDTYRRRPALSPEDVSAMMPVALGSGVNVYGTYIFQGAENPDGKLTTLQESRATGYGTDVPVKSYDFQAPLSEFGEERESFRQLKLFNYFLNDFGSELAPMVPHLPESISKGASDLKTLRFAVRTDGQHGFLFLNNYVRGYPMQSHKAVQFEVNLPKVKLHIPDEPVDIPSGAYFIWPFNLDLEGINLRYSTAQLFTKLSSGAESIYVFFCIPGVRCDFAFANDPGLEVRGGAVPASHQNGELYFRDLPPDTFIVLQSKRGKRVRIVLLTQQEAEDSWKIRMHDHSYLLLTKQEFYASPDHLFLQSEGNPNFHFKVLPGIQNRVKADVSLRSEPWQLGGTAFWGQVPERHVGFSYKQIQDAGMFSPSPSAPAMKDRVPEAPTEKQFQAAEKWMLAFSPNSMDGVSNIFVRFDYVGDVARLTQNNHLLTDDFYNGNPWKVGLKRFSEDGQIPQLELSILPLKKDVPIFLEDRVREQLPLGPEALELKTVTVLPIYQMGVDTGK